MICLKITVLLTLHQLHVFWLFFILYYLTSSFSAVIISMATTGCSLTGNAKISHNKFSQLTCVVLFVRRTESFPSIWAFCKSMHFKNQPTIYSRYWSCNVYVLMVPLGFWKHLRTWSQREMMNNNNHHEDECFTVCFVFSPSAWPPAQGWTRCITFIWATKGLCPSQLNSCSSLSCSINI